LIRRLGTVDSNGERNMFKLRHENYIFLLKKWNLLT